MRKTQLTTRFIGLGTLALAGAFLLAPAAQADPQAARSRSSASSSSGRSSSVSGGSSAARSAPSASRSHSSGRRAAVTRSTGRPPTGTRTMVRGTATHRSHGLGGRSYGHHTGYPHRYNPYYYGGYPYYYGGYPYYGLSFGLGWWGGYYSPYYSPYYSYGPTYYRYGGPAAATRVEVAPVGAFDLAVKPKKTEVWVDGRFVGTAGRFDGFPDYLWLEEGAHQIVFYLEGHVTVERQVETLAAVVSELRVDMEPGRSIPPRQLALKPAPAPAPSYQRQSPAPPVGGGETESEAVAGAAAGSAGSLDLRQPPGRLVLAVEPDDASVYLDGRYLGTGRDLARLHAGLLIESGEHRLEIVRPGYADRSLDFSVAAGEEERIEVGLESG